MPSDQQTRTRSQRVASVTVRPGPLREMLDSLQRGPVVLRLLLCMVTALTLWGITQGWDPPRGYWPDQRPSRDIIVRTDFRQADAEATEEARRLARSLAVAIYDHDPAPLIQLKARLQNRVTQLLGAEDFGSVDRPLWEEFALPLAEKTPQPTEQESAEQFERFKKALSEEEASIAFKAALKDAFAPLEQFGVIDGLPEDHDANRERIAIRPVGTIGNEVTKPVGDLLLENVLNALQRTLGQKMPTVEVADRVFAWLRPRLKSTLKLNSDATRLSQDTAAAEVEQAYETYPAGATIAKAGQPLGDEQLLLLELEYQAELANRTLADQAIRSLAVLGMYVALFTLCGFFIVKLDRTLIDDFARFITLLFTVVATVVLTLPVYRYEWRPEVIPLLLFGMTITIASRQDLALLLSAAMTLISVLSVGHELADGVILLATTSGAILALDSVRTRSKLLLVGFIAALVAFFTSLGVGVLSGQSAVEASRLGVMMALWSIVAGSLMTWLVLGVERLFKVQTDLSLLEWGDPAKPLLQELIRRAPGTYNHSITVASLAEAAADSIGARGLLVRVGAYYHDIGKMLKPGYFVENQLSGDNRHDALVPAMSTLVIIAHVKDGADLARQNSLPEQLIDFIQQHHGTTLVEYFYRQAESQQQEDPDAGEVDESSFRYPGPKPQTREAGVLMLADAVESASRVLVEPTPARIESLVEELTKKRLDDGQFDECGLTLEEVRKVGDSLVKSLTAVYHGRVKYPEQDTA